MEKMITILQNGRLIQVPMGSLVDGTEGICEPRQEESIFVEDRQAGPAVDEGAAIAPSKGKKVAGNKRNLSGKGDK